MTSLIPSFSTLSQVAWVSFLFIISGIPKFLMNQEWGRIENILEIGNIKRGGEPIVTNLYTNMDIFNNI